MDFLMARLVMAGRRLGRLRYGLAGHAMLGRMALGLAALGMAAGLCTQPAQAQRNFRQPLQGIGTMVGVFTLGCGAPQANGARNWEFRLNGAVAAYGPGCTGADTWELVSLPEGQRAAVFHGTYFSDVYVKLRGGDGGVRAVGLRLSRTALPVVIDYTRFATDPSLSYLSDDIAELRVALPAVVAAPAAAKPTMAAADKAVAKPDAAVAKPDKTASKTDSVTTLKPQGKATPSAEVAAVPAVPVCAVQVDWAQGIVQSVRVKSASQQRADNERCTALARGVEIHNVQ